MDAVNHSGGSCLRAAGNEKGDGEAGGAGAEAERHLLRSAGDGTRPTGPFFSDVGVNERVHFGVLQPAEESETEGRQDDQPDPTLRADGGEKENQQAEDDVARIVLSWINRF